MHGVRSFVVASQVHMRASRGVALGRQVSCKIPKESHCHMLGDTLPFPHVARVPKSLRGGASSSDEDREHVQSAAPDYAIIGAGSTSDVELMTDAILSATRRAFYKLSATDVVHEVVRTHAIATHWAPTHGILHIDDGAEGRDLPLAFNNSLGKAFSSLQSTWRFCLRSPEYLRTSFERGRRGWILVLRRRLAWSTSVRCAVAPDHASFNRNIVAWPGAIHQRMHQLVGGVCFALRSKSGIHA